MPSLPNPGQIVAQIETAVTGAIGQDITNVTGFARDQLQRIEKLSLKLGRMILDGEFNDDPEDIQDFLDILKDLATNFVNTLKGLAVVIIEKAWNALVNVVWGILDKAAGFSLPRPSFG